MARQNRPNIAQADLFTSHYEENFLLRTLGGDLIRRPEVALSELVANAWDAGAAHVEVTIPERRNEALIVQDDGCGLTKEQFNQRWMTLGYNRQRHQGGEVEFPPGRDGHRRAYGRNGQGRHGLLCFGSSYTVDTVRAGQRAVFEVRVSSGEHPFLSSLTSESTSRGHGTRLSVIVEKNLPGADRIRELLSTKFLHDPGFTISVNGTTIPMTDLPGYAGETRLSIKDPTSDKIAHLQLTVIEAEAGRTKHQSGVAFWVERRLVGEPGWSVMGEPLLDGRTRPGRRLTIVVQSDDLLDEVLPDWTGFRRNALTTEVGLGVTEAARDILRRIYSARIRETTSEVLGELRGQMEPLGRGDRAEIAEVAESIAHANPLIAPSSLAAAVTGVIEAKKQSSVQALFKRLEALPADDIDGLHRLLDEWTVRDALTVLDEIGRRIKTTEAIQKLMSNHTIDELEVLHPLVTHARWLFGPEYDSPHYSFNLGLRNAMSKVFHIKPNGDAFRNPRKQPDLLVRGNSSLSAVATEDIDTNTGIATCRRVLLVELKKGGFRIKREEMEQASNYVIDLLGCGHLTGAPFIQAFVVGHELEPRDTLQRQLGPAGASARVDAVTFANLVTTANARLFRIREQVEDRYPESAADVAQAVQLDLAGLAKALPMEPS